MYTVHTYGAKLICRGKLRPDIRYPDKYLRALCNSQHPSWTFATWHRDGSALNRSGIVWRWTIGPGTVDRCIGGTHGKQ